MSSHRRAQPWLGTLVEVRVEAPSRLAFDDAADAAFAAIAEVHRLMSFHAAGSDVRRIARARAGDRLRVHARTAAVLRQSMRWARLSQGAFDPACGRRAVAAGWLPMPADVALGAEANASAAPAFEAASGIETDIGKSESGRSPSSSEATIDEALVLAGDEVQVRAPTWLDLGGIAKGYAVDCAVAALRRRGIASGIVNAGGDLRVFGPQEEAIHVRSPFDPALLVPVAALRDAACATSASGRMLSSSTEDPPPAAPCSVTVIAPTACAADALTKVVWVQGRASARLLRRARARAFVVEADGGTWRL